MKIDSMSVSQRMISTYGNNINKVTEKLSSGKGINSAADNAAGLGISEKMLSQIKGEIQAIKNAQDGISMVQTAESSLGSTTESLQRMRELAVQASNGTLSDTDRKVLNDEFTQLKDEISKTAQSATFNNKKLLDGSLNETIATGADGTGTKVSVSDMSSNGLNIENLSIDNIKNATDAIEKIEGAIDKVSVQRADLGAVSNSLEAEISNLTITEENTQAAQSQITDADMAKMMMQLTKEKILQQSSIAMMTHNRQTAGTVLQLLK